MKKALFIFVVISSVISVESGRSPQRYPDPLMPKIKVQWANEETVYELEDSHLQEHPLFHLYDQSYLEQYLLPNTEITYRHSEQSVSGCILKSLIEELLQEIQEGRKTFSHFSVLKKRDFKQKSKTGLIILKFNDYPFVLKLFIETPESFIDPYHKGFEPCCFFIMGGTTRHLSGFTRIRNLRSMEHLIEQDDYWKTRVNFPRKWFWLPSNCPYITITSYNIGKECIRTIQLPAVYGLICDYIDVERTLTLNKQDDRRLALELSNYLRQQIDPHITNFVIEKETGDIIPLDSEHFPTMVGIENPQPCKSYVQWYSHLSFKMFNDTFLRTKKCRRTCQYKTCIT